jgi:hypothetical protein
MKTISCSATLETNGTEVELYYDITERVDLYDMEYIVEPWTSAMSYYILHTPPVRI